MPAKYLGTPTTPTPAPAPSGARYVGRGAPAPDEGESSLLPAAAAAAVAAGTYGLVKNPSLAKKAGNAFLDLRRMSMLSGLAPLKSFLGNIGGTAYESLERSSLRPLAELFSPQTVADFKAAWKTPNFEAAGPATGLTKFNIPGRFMGAMDTAAQGALTRGGLSQAEAEAAMLQTPLDPKTAKALENPVMDYLVPFRRTPFNQFREGAAAFAPNTRGKAAALATALTSGFGEGLVIDDPKTQSLATAAAGRYGLPTAMGAALGRTARGMSRKDAEDALRGLSPISDYSIAEGTLAPVEGRIMPKPALVGLLDYLNSLGR